MQVTIRTCEDFAILEMHGKLVAGKDIRNLRDAIHTAAEKNLPKIVLSFANVTCVDSCGIGELVGTFTYVKNQGKTLILTALPQRVRTLLDIAKLASVFEIYDSEQAAVADSRQRALLSRMSR